MSWPHLPGRPETRSRGHNAPSVRPMNLNESYRSPLETRYGSAEMRAIWSPQRTYSTWRRLWLALAEAQCELGLNISRGQVEELRAHLDDIDYDRAAEYEARFHHDVMAHIHTLGDAAPKARPIIHLGATSQFVNCNTELIQIRDGLRLVAGKLAALIDTLSTFAARWRDLPTLGLTHLQPAQPTTVGKRATLWANDLAMALEEIEHRLSTLRFRGVKGATGTQASFLRLFDGDQEKVERLDELVCRKMDWPPDKRFVVTGQTYPRLVDALVVGSLAVTAAAISKCSNDLRLLASRSEVREPAGPEQVGSSTMPHKRNPMLCERATGLARFVMSLPANSLSTAASQWLERSLDDSANRRLVLPQSFLALDAAVEVMRQVAGGLDLCPRTIAFNLNRELAFLAGENILMAAVAAGADRQEVHEILRRHSRAAAERMSTEGGPNDLLDRLGNEPIFAGLDLATFADPVASVGRAPQQVQRFIEQVAEPIRRRYPDELPKT